MDEAACRLSFRPGARVRLRGLVSAPELNGVTGRLQSFHSEKERWAVVVPGGAAPKLLKAQNLEVVAGEPYDFTNILVDVLAEEIVLRMCSFLPGRTLMNLGESSKVLHSHSQNCEALWHSLCVSLLGEALVHLHMAAWRKDEHPDLPEFWRCLFRAGCEGKSFYYDDDIRKRCLHSDFLLDKKVVVEADTQIGGLGPMVIKQGAYDKAVERVLSASGHTACAFGSRIVKIGGWRPRSLDELLHVSIVDLENIRIFEPELASASERPGRRLRHSSCVVRSSLEVCSILVLGGCNDRTQEPCEGLQTLTFLDSTEPDFSKIRWWSTKAEGAAPQAIWHHTAGSFSQGKKVILFGGDFPTSDPEFLHIGDRAYACHVYILDVALRHWERVATHGHNPGWRSLHVGVAYTSLADASERFVIMGGCTEHLGIFCGPGKKFSDMVGYSLNLKSFKWRRSAHSGFIPKPRMRFAADRYGRHLLVFGGHGVDVEIPGDESLLKLNLMTLQWEHAEVANAPGSHAIAPAAAFAGGCVLGGVSVNAGGVEPVPKFDVVCLCPPGVSEGLQEMYEMIADAV